MHYSLISAALVALVSSVVAQTAGFDTITSPTLDQDIPAGSSFDIVWEPESVDGTVTITLLQGATNSTLEAGPVIAAGINNTLGTYTWAVPTTSSFATYGFKIVLDSTANSANPTFQYSYAFHITGGSSSSSAGPVSTTTISLSTGPNYSSTPTAAGATPSSSVSNYTISSSATPVSVPSSSSNATLSTVSSTVSSTATTVSSSGSSQTSSTPATSSNAAMSNIATGGLALVGGIVVALAL